MQTPTFVSVEWAFYELIHSDKENAERSDPDGVLRISEYKR